MEPFGDIMGTCAGPAQDKEPLFNSQGFSHLETPFSKMGAHPGVWNLRNCIPFSAPLLALSQALANSVFLTAQKSV